jgi:hypothetical protein
LETPLRRLLTPWKSVISQLPTGCDRGATQLIKQRFTNLEAALQTLTATNADYYYYSYSGVAVRLCGAYSNLI